MTDEDVGAAARAEFTRLFNERSRAVLGYLLRRVGHPEDAADLLAEVFVVAWRRFAEIPPGRAARPWLFGVARLRLNNGQRRTRRQDALVARLRSALITSAPLVPAEERDEALARALAALADGDRELLLLVSWDGLKPAEAGQVLGISAPAARVRLHRARARLRAVLVTEEDGELQRLPSPDK